MIEKGKVSQEPFLGILKILEEAESLNLVDWNAMNIASVDQMNQPSSRMVLLKKISDEGLVFYTNYNSRKGKEISLNPKVAVNFWWRELKKQIRIEGFIEKASEEDSDDYFNSRPLKSRVSAIISNQSSVISSYEDLTNQIDNYLEKNDESSIKRPNHCGFIIVLPNAVEFWQERDNRTHERLKYFLSDDQKWSSCLLSP
ncbi:MAG: pyridoxine/pyridoxamine 5'-phosphate oxidase [Gammaproteobacteria bacterium]|nr:MAG: pyridoxine/pyridoxamine 5'-phosphate oxidase [Gammaproteobacteria bacterium]